MSEIVVKLDEMLLKRKMRLNELSALVNITEANLSVLKNNHAKAIRFSTLQLLCAALNCLPGELLELRQNSNSDKADKATIFL